MDGQVVLLQIVQDCSIQCETPIPDLATWTQCFFFVHQCSWLAPGKNPAPPNFLASDCKIEGWYRRKQNGASGAWLSISHPLPIPVITFLGMELDSLQMEIQLSAAIWGQFRLSDNSAVVALNSGSSKDETLMHLICCLVFIMAKFNFVVSASHVRGTHNTPADALSRNNRECLLLHYPLAQHTKSVVGPGDNIKTRLDIPSLDHSEELYFHSGLAPKLPAHILYICTALTFTFLLYISTPPTPDIQKKICQFCFLFS